MCKGCHQEALDSLVGLPHAHLKTLDQLLELLVRERGGGGGREGEGEGEGERERERDGEEQNKKGKEKNIRGEYSLFSFLPALSPSLFPHSQNTPFTGVQTDYKLVFSSEAGEAAAAGSGGEDEQRQAPSSGGPLYYSSSRGLYLSAAVSASAASASAAIISSPPRVRCAISGTWKRARPVTDDGGKSGS